MAKHEDLGPPLKRKRWKPDALELYRLGVSPARIAVRLQVELRLVLHFLVEDPKGPRDIKIRRAFSAWFEYSRERWGREEGTKK